MFVFAIVATAAPGSSAAQKSVAAFTCLFLFCYGASWGAVSQVLLGELSSTKLRSKTVALATAAGWICDLLIICGIPYLLSPAYVNMGAKVGFIFGGCQIAVFLWALWFIPGLHLLSDDDLPRRCCICPTVHDTKALVETKDRTLEEIDEMFLNVSFALSPISGYGALESNIFQ